MTVSDCFGSGSLRERFLALKRQLTDVKLDALLRETEPAADIDDLDAIVAEVVAGVENRRQVQSVRGYGTPTPRSHDLSRSPGQQGPV